MQYLIHLDEISIRHKHTNCIIWLFFKDSFVGWTFTITLFFSISILMFSKTDLYFVTLFPSWVVAKPSGINMPLWINVFTFRYPDVCGILLVSNMSEIIRDSSMTAFKIFFLSSSPKDSRINFVSD